MIYTLGLTKSYLNAINERPEPVKKTGKREPSEDWPEGYEGGSVWETREDAQAYVDSLPNRECPEWRAEDFSVFGVEADWRTDTYQAHPEKPYRSLLVDSIIVVLGEQ